MRSSISLTNRSIQRMYGQLLKLRPWHQVRTIANHGNSWSFVRKNAELAKLAYGANYDQVMGAPVTIALFTDTDLQRRARKIARVGGVQNFTEEQLQYFMQNLPAE